MSDSRYINIAQKMDNASKYLSDRQVAQEESRWRQKDRHRSTYRIADPDFPTEISLDLRKLCSYNPNRQKQCLINYQFDQCIIGNIALRGSMSRFKLLSQIQEKKS